MMARKRTWIWVVVGAIGLVVLAFIAFAAAMTYLVVRDLDIRDSSAVSASTEFERVRQRFAGQEPLIMVDDIDAARPRITKRAVGAPAARKPETLHILAFDPDDEKLVRLHLPFWLLRFGNQGRIQIGRGTVEVEKLGLTVGDLERHGPGLVLDHQGKDGERVLLWME